jgi:hypothetical protein
MIFFSLLLLVMACWDRDLGEDSRQLGSWQVDGTMLTLEAQWSGKHRAARMHEFDRIEASDRFQLSWVMSGITDQIPLRSASGGSNGWRVLSEKRKAQDALASLNVEACSRQDALVYRVSDPGAKEPPPWWMVWPTEHALVQLHAPMQQGDCDAVLASAPSWDGWLVEEANGPAACELAKLEERFIDLIRCEFRVSGELFWDDTNDSSFVADRRLAKEDAEQPAITEAIFEVVAPQAPLDGYAPTVARYVQFTPVPSRQVQWIDEVVAFCTSTDARCEPWRLRAAAMVASAQTDSSSCERLADAAIQLLAVGEMAADQSALAAIAPVAGCAPPSKVAIVMRAGLSRRTSEEVSLPSPDFRSYGAVDNNCQHQSVMQGGPKAGMSTLCSSFPRVAGSWLSSHCDDQAIAAATEAAEGARPDYDPRTDMVFDGALRVLASCDKDAFEKAIANAPDLPGRKMSPDARGKEKLRMLFLKDVE